MDLRAIAQFIQSAETEDLLDRVTVYRQDMEPAALDLMENELSRRGWNRREIASHAEKRAAICLRKPDGSYERCNFCNRPAIVRRWGWQKLWGRWPIFPRPLLYCAEHVTTGTC